MSVHPSVPLGEVCEVNPRRREIPRSPDLPVSFVPMAAVDERWGEIAHREDRPFADVAKGYTSFRHGDVLFAKITPCMENGKVAIARDLTNGFGFGSTEFFVLRPGASVLGEYLFFFLRQPAVRAQAKRHFTGTAGQQRVPKSYLEAMPMPLPSLDEQRRVVAIVSHAANVERLRARADERLRELVPSVFIRMFGDPTRNPMRWDVRPLGDLCQSVRYGTSKKPSSEEGDGLPVIRMGNVTYDGHLDCTDLKTVVLPDAEADKHALEPGDILFNRTNSKELVGKTGIWDGRFPAVAASYFIRLRVDTTCVHPAYVWAFMNSASVKRRLLGMARGAIGQANINAREVQSLPLPVPPIEHQHRFARIVKRAGKVADLPAAGTEFRLTESLLERLL